MNICDYWSVLSGIDVLDSLTEDELSQLAGSSRCSLREYAKGQVVHIQNEPCNAVDFVLEGRVSVQNMADSGNVLTISTFSAGDILGANLVFSSRNYYPMTVVAVSRTTILHLHRELMLELCQLNAGFMIALMRAISDRTLILTDKISSISLKTIRQRITDFLESESRLQQSRVVRLNMSKKDLAERLGVQRTSLSRELNKMRRDGLLEFDAKTITLKRIDADTPSKR